MAKEIRLPQLGQTMEEGTIVNCLINVGDEIKKGDVIFEIETDKATLEMESPGDGFVKHIFVKVDETLLVGEPLLVIGDADEDVPQSFIDSIKGTSASEPEASQAEPASTASAPAVAPAEPVRSEPEPTKSPGRIMASPRAKKIAEELGVDLTTVKGTGPAGKITEQDVKAAAESKPSTAAPSVASEGNIKLGKTIPVNRMQKITAERMLQSKREIPCFYLTVRADATNMVELRAEMNKDSDVKISYNDFIIKAVASGLEKYPIMTGQLDGANIKLADTVNVGLAISVGDSLVAPILKDMNKKSLKDVARESKAIIEKARSNKLAPADLEGGCITVSNLGAFGIDNFIPIVVPGQCSILGIGRITDTCVPSDGNILVRKFMNMTLSVDHKVANGAYAAQFLDYVKKMLEYPSALAE